MRSTLSLLRRVLLRSCVASLSLLVAGSPAEGEEPPGADPDAPSAAGPWDPAISAAAIRTRVTQRFELYNPHSIEHLRAIREMGFTQVILDWPNLHAEATALGLDVVMANWWTPENEFAQLEKGIAAAKQVERQRLAGVSMMDEPERNSPETPLSYYEALYVDLRERFDRELPGVPLEISHWGPLRSWTRDHYTAFLPLYRGTDRVRIMPYPDLGEGPLDEVYRQMQRSRYLMKLAGRELPLVVILQTWVLPKDPKLPTIDELRVMAYQAMLGGAETVSFFSYDPEQWSRTPGFTEGFAGLMRELTAFRSRYAEAEVISRLDSAGVLHVELVQPGRQVERLRVNTRREPVGDLAPLAVAGPFEEETHAAATASRSRCGRRNGFFLTIGRPYRHHPAPARSRVILLKTGSCHDPTPPGRPRRSVNQGTGYRP